MPMPRIPEPYHVSKVTSRLALGQAARPQASRVSHSWECLEGILIARLVYIYLMQCRHKVALYLCGKPLCGFSETGD